MEKAKSGVTGQDQAVASGDAVAVLDDGAEIPRAEGTGDRYEGSPQEERVDHKSGTHLLGVSEMGSRQQGHDPGPTKASPLPSEGLGAAGDRLPTERRSLTSGLSGEASRMMQAANFHVCAVF